jgi:hypothetical protein
MGRKSARDPRRGSQGRAALTHQQLREQAEVLKDVVREAGIRAAIAQAHIESSEHGGDEAIFLIEDNADAAYLHITDTGLISVTPIFMGSGKFVQRVRALFVKVGLGKWLQ